MAPECKGDPPDPPPHGAPWTTALQRSHCHEDSHLWRIFVPSVKMPNPKCEALRGGVGVAY
eukprot:4056354-Ditylum_brightwellii.AAC.1